MKTPLGFRIQGLGCWDGGLRGCGGEDTFFHDCVLAVYRRESERVRGPFASLASPPVISTVGGSDLIRVAACPHLGLGELRDGEEPTDSHLKRADEPPAFFADALDDRSSSS